ncbi:putative Fe-Mo cluster-binding NifX family protein [Desulfitispora alkaliphila]|uniref:NifB/NifX family molybdenum-iron cluster-binding protein n=1 Tax=Desulfitispora alkaliphila TaxID=622674 RepID=UPI003D1B9943
MKIAISTEGKSIESIMNPRFGRCSYFLICDTESGTTKALENSGQQSEKGAGIAAAQQVMDEGVDVLITGSLGPNAFELIENSDIRVYKGEELSCGTLLEKLKNGELEKITEAGLPHMGMKQGGN